MRILILGAGGMLGHALLNEFASDDIMVADLPQFDITDYQNIANKIKDFKPGIIINAAGFTDVDGAEAKTKEAELVNGQAVGNLARIASEIGAIFVHYSTDYVFDGNLESGYKEDDKPNPLNAYGKSKYLGEKLIKQNCQKYYLIRTSWLYGKNGKNFVNTVIDLAGKQDNLEIVEDQTGCPTYAADLAKATRELLISNKSYGIYHLTNDGYCNWFEFATAIKNLHNLDVKIKPVKSNKFSRPAQRPKYSILQNTKTAKLRNWQEALKEYLSLIKKLK